VSRLTPRKADEIAAEVIEVLAPACDRIEVTGELRRRRPIVTKIELLVLSKHAAGAIDLWGQVHGDKSLFDEHFARCIKVAGLEYRLDEKQRRVWGDEFKRAWVGSVPLEIYMVKGRDEWGLAQIFQTGPYAFVEKVKCLLVQRGVIDGRVYRDDHGTVVPTPEEADVFSILGMPFAEPVRRRG
jgi:DNA polymerase/3'-5' exonuclease PolX